MSLCVKRIGNIPTDIRYASPVTDPEGKTIEFYDRNGNKSAVLYEDMKLIHKDGFIEDVDSLMISDISVIMEIGNKTFTAEIGSPPGKYSWKLLDKFRIAERVKGRGHYFELSDNNRTMYFYPEFSNLRDCRSMLNEKDERCLQWNWVFS